MSCLDMEREHIENVIKMHAEVGKNGYSPYIDEITGTWFVFDDVSRKYVDTNIRAKGANSWEDIDGKPESFPPSEHNHDDRYYTGQDIDMMINSVRNEIPSLNGYATSQDVDIQIQNLRNEIPSLNGYATESWVESKGYVTKESLDKQYELIEKITLTEDVTQISRTSELDGKAYNFKKLFIDYKGEKTMSRFRVQGNYKYGNNTFNYNCYIVANHAMGYIEVDASDVLKYYGAGGGAGGYTVPWCTTGAYAQIQKADSITSLIIEGTSSLYAGTVINIYGVRA